MMKKIIKNATILPCKDDRVIENGTVILEDDRIVAVGPAADFGQDVEGADIIDASGKYLMPGKIDMHEHLDLKYAIGSFWQITRQPHPNALSLSSHWTLGRSVRSCLHSLARGVTTVRDVGSLDSVNVIVRDLVDKGMIYGPRIYACGAAIAMTGGHGVPHSVEADGAVGVKTAVRNELKKGANVIKFMASGGGLLADRDLQHTMQLGLDELRAGVEEAHKAERKVAVHAHPKSAILAAIEAGADTIEHAGLADQESAEALARSGVYVIPTLTVTAMLDSVGAGHDLPGHARAKEIQAVRQKSYRQVVEAGSKLAVGTDGYEDMGIEMRLMAEWGGLSNMDILIAATMGGARALGAADELGSIEVGKLADIILLEKDPRADLESTDNPFLVFKGGMQFNPSTLLAAVPADRTIEFNLALFLGGDNGRSVEPECEWHRAEIQQERFPHRERSLLGRWRGTFHAVCRPRLRPSQPGRRYSGDRRPH